MPTPLCDACGRRPAAIYQAHTGRRLCRECFLEDVRRRALREIERWRLFGPGDTLLLGLSGGKDSYVLLDILASIHSPSRIVAVSIVEGVPGYNREEDISRLRRVARDYGVDVIVTSIREYTGHSLTELVLESWRRRRRVSPCTICGISRRRILNYYARMYGATRTVTAHNLDDEAQTAVANILRGDVVGLARLHPLAPPASPLIVPRVKPLRKIYEWETATYALFRGFPMQETECIFINLAPTLRARVREALYRVEHSRPGALLRLMEALDTLLEPLARGLRPGGLGSCEKCGEPTSPGRRLCKLCEILEAAGVSEPAYAVPLRRRSAKISGAGQGRAGGVEAR